MPKAYVLGTDIDAKAVDIAAKTLEPYKPRVGLHQSSYVNLHKQPRFPHIFGPDKQLDFVLLDLGLSSYQLSSADRGFSFSKEGPLDMRFDQSDPTSVDCFKLVNFASEYELQEVFKRFGEEKLYRELADNLVTYRRTKQITSTTELAEIFHFTFKKAQSLNRFRSVTRSFQVWGR
jgi:16S rRNA (cytosine1402-N4)-methyltransferase